MCLLSLLAIITDTLRNVRGTVSVKECLLPRDKENKEDENLYCLRVSPIIERDSGSLVYPLGPKFTPTQTED